MSYSGSDMVLEDRDFSVPTPVPQSTVSAVSTVMMVPMYSNIVSSVHSGVVTPTHIRSGVMVTGYDMTQYRDNSVHTCTSGSEAMRDSHVNQTGWSGIVSKSVSFQAIGRDTSTYKDSGMASYQNDQTEDNFNFWRPIEEGSDAGTQYSPVNIGPALEYERVAIAGDVRYRGSTGMFINPQSPNSPKWEQPSFTTSEVTSNVSNKYFENLSIHMSSQSQASGPVHARATPRSNVASYGLLTVTTPSTMIPKCLDSITADQRVNQVSPRMSTGFSDAPNPYVSGMKVSPHSPKQIPITEMHGLTLTQGPKHVQMPPLLTCPSTAGSPIIHGTSDQTERKGSATIHNQFVSSHVEHTPINQMYVPYQTRMQTNDCSPPLPVTIRVDPSVSCDNSHENSCHESPPVESPHYLTSGFANNMLQPKQGFYNRNNVGDESPVVFQGSISSAMNNVLSQPASGYASKYVVSQQSNYVTQQPLNNMSSQSNVIPQQMNNVTSQPTNSFASDYVVSQQSNYVTQQQLHNVSQLSSMPQQSHYVAPQSSNNVGVSQHTSYVAPQHANYATPRQSHYVATQFSNNIASQPPSYVKVQPSHYVTEQPTDYAPTQIAYQVAAQPSRYNTPQVSSYFEAQHGINNAAQLTNATSQPSGNNALQHRSSTARQLPNSSTINVVTQPMRNIDQHSTNNVTLHSVSNMTAHRAINTKPQPIYAVPQHSVLQQANSVVPQHMNVVPQRNKELQQANTVVPQPMNVGPQLTNAVLYPANNVVPQRNHVPQQANSFVPQHMNVVPQSNNVPQQANSIVPPQPMNVVPQSTNVVSYPARSIVPQHMSVVPQHNTVLQQANSIVPQHINFVPQHNVLQQANNVVPQRNNVPQQVNSVVPRYMNVAPQSTNTVPYPSNNVVPPRNNVPQQARNVVSQHINVPQSTSVVSYPANNILPPHMNVVSQAIHVDSQHATNAVPQQANNVAPQPINVVSQPVSNVVTQPASNVAPPFAVAGPLAYSIQGSMGSNIIIDRNSGTVPNDRYYSMPQGASQIQPIPLGNSLNNANSMGSNFLQLQGPDVPYNVPQQNQMGKAPQTLSKASEGNDKIGSIGITGNPSQYLVDRSVSSTQKLDASENYPNVSNVNSSKNKMLEPETFDGISSAEWAEYIIHFEQIAEWNNWSNTQKAKMLSIKLRGEAQKLLGSLSSDQYNNYETLKTTLSHRFNPQERESAYRCEFRNRRRKKDESPSDFGFALRRLSLKAFPTLPYSALETHVLDQFIAGLGSPELQKFVQFQHPKTLEAAINLAIEYTAFVGNLDKVMKPSLDNEGEITATVNELESHRTTSLRPLEFNSNVTRNELEQTIEGIVSKKWEKIENQMGQLLQAIQNSKNNENLSEENSKTRSVDSPPRARSRSRSPGRSPLRKRDSTPLSIRSRNNSPNRPMANESRHIESRQIICTYCNRQGHIENRCWTKMRDMENASLRGPLN